MKPIPIKSEEEMEKMREGGQILAKVLNEVEKRAKVGVSTLKLDEFAENFIRERGATPGFKGYRGFPGTLCTCRNEKIVHGIPKKDDFLQEGDLFTIDCGVLYKGMYTDAARSFGIGEISPLKQKLIKTAQIALDSATQLAKPGTHLNEISETIQKIVENAGFHVVKDLTGHGIGKNLHEPPMILNFSEGNPGPVLKPGMTLAIEPIFAASTGKMKTLPDKWTLITIDKSPAVQMENTILITQNGNEILTKIS